MKRVKVKAEQQQQQAPRLGISPRLMNKISKDNAEIVVRYVREMGYEGHTTKHCSSSGGWAARLAAFSNKPYKKMTRDDVLGFLDTFEKEEDKDPLHKWIGTYNNIRIHIRRFFRWLYFPDMSSVERKKLQSLPKVIQNIPRKARREKDIYEHSDMWTQEDVAIFQKYSKSPRDRAYVAMAIETDARPHELLKLRIRDIEDRLTASGDKQYCEFTARGKTGKRGLVLINSIPWIRQWISAHPMSHPDAILFCSVKKNQMETRSLAEIFTAYKRDTFPALLSNTDIPDSDKEKIRNLLKKPWNPYVFRHTGLTHKHKILKEAQLRLHAGWAPGSQMHQRYIHLSGNEANETLLQESGILSPLHEKDLLRSNVECPQCHKDNPPDTRFCYSCKMVMSYQGYQEALESQVKEGQELQALRNEAADIEGAYGQDGGVAAEDYRALRGDENSKIQ